MEEKSVLIDCNTRIAGKAHEQTDWCQHWKRSCSGCHIPFSSSPVSSAELGDDAHWPLKKKIKPFSSNSCLILLFSVLFFQWKAARIGLWTTWNIRCSWGNLYGLSALYSMDISGPTTPMRRAQDLALCGTKVQDMGTSRNPSVLTAQGWARRKMPYGFDQQSWTMWVTIHAY